MPKVVWQKAEYIRQAGNVAVHGNRSPAPEKALDVVAGAVSRPLLDGPHLPAQGRRESYRARSSTNLSSRKWNRPPPQPSVQELEALKVQRDAAEEARTEIESELEALRERLAAIKAENEGVHETHDWNEDKTRTLIIDLDLERAGWPLDREQDREYEVTGMPNESGIGYADYVLWGDDGKPLAVVEAKKTTVDPVVGQQPGEALRRLPGDRCMASVRSSSTPTGTRPACGMTSPIPPRQRSPGSTRRTSSRP